MVRSLWKMPGSNAIARGRAYVSRVKPLILTKERRGPHMYRSLSEKEKSHLSSLCQVIWVPRIRMEEEDIQLKFS